MNSIISLQPSRELVAFIFHPYEPFIISIQKLASRYVVNFHIYNEASVVKQDREATTVLEQKLEFS